MPLEGDWMPKVLNALGRMFAGISPGESSLGPL